MIVRLLVVDDEKPMVEVLTRFMKPMSSLIDSTDTLEDALRMASQNHYNICILDLKLLNTGKEEALRAIRTIKSYATAVVVVSGLQEPNLKNEVMAAGADAFVRKDGDTLSRSLLLAANIAVLHLPRESFKSDSFSEHVALLHGMASA